ncbi:MAG: DUF4178 domain-containing protein [Acidobacteria bacterium]|nr:DUF4178 domain-containing protein [Acidobacteriota bacterium]
MTPPSAPQVKMQSLYCPNCGGGVELRGFANTLTVVCRHCASILDTGTPTVRIIGQFQTAQIRKPIIELGARGKFDNTTYEIIGFQVRSDEHEEWEWAEYVLFNPFKGFLYLTEYNGHWNLVRPVRAIPASASSGARPAVIWQGRTHRHFQSAVAKTLFVLGEFPWRVAVGEKVRVDDYTCPPYVLSAEHTGSETTWSEGEYYDGCRIWQAFGLQGAPPSARGIYVNQPAPTESSREVLRLCAILELALIVMALFFYVTDRHETVLKETRQFVQSSTGEASYVTPPFELKGRTSNVQVRTETDVDNHWVYFNYALINSDNGHAYDFGREVSYYYGRDSDGSWSEGGRNDTVTIPSVPSGRYYLRVEPEGDPGTPPVTYTVTLRRDIPNGTFFVLAALLLPVPAIIVWWRRYKYEYSRWQESDYASGGGDD